MRALRGNKALVFVPYYCLLVVAQVHPVRNSTTVGDILTPDATALLGATATGLSRLTNIWTGPFPSGPNSPQFTTNSSYHWPFGPPVLATDGTANPSVILDSSAQSTANAIPTTGHYVIPSRSTLNPFATADETSDRVVVPPRSTLSSSTLINDTVRSSTVAGSTRASSTAVESIQASSASSTAADSTYASSTAAQSPQASSTAAESIPASSIAVDSASDLSTVLNSTSGPFNPPPSSTQLGTSTGAGILPVLPLEPTDTPVDRLDDKNLDDENPNNENPGDNSFGLPGLPGLPGPPNLPGIPSLPDLPNVPSPPGSTSFPSVAPLPVLPPGLPLSPPGSPPPSPTPTSAPSRSSSSSSCILRTISDCNVACTATATTTIGGPNKRAEGDACTTTCGMPITTCSGTGTTTLSTVTSTTTVSRRLCERDCAACRGDNIALPTGSLNLEAYSKAANGARYLPAPTISAFPVDNSAVKARRDKLGVNSTSFLLRRTLPNPQDAAFNGDVGLWLRLGIQLSQRRLVHGTSDGIYTTGFSFQLGNEPNSWSLTDLYGCTSVIVISRKRIFMTHIWENPTFVDLTRFQREGLDAIRYGDPGVPQGLNAFTGPGGDFENTLENKVRAFVITPYGNVDQVGTSSLAHPTEVGMIHTLIADVLGRTDTMTIPYIRAYPDPEFVWSTGKVLIQYDPVQAMQSTAGCIRQIAQVELWFEDHPTYRYQDAWVAFPHQRIIEPLPRRSMSRDGSENMRWLRGREVTDEEEEEWKEYEMVMKRQEGDFCPVPNQSTSTLASASPASKVPSTFGTSFLPSTRGQSSSGAERPRSSTQGTPSSTDANPSETSAPPVNQTPTKALSVVMKQKKTDNGKFNEWNFFETTWNKQADPCRAPAHGDVATRWNDSKLEEIYSPPWPHGVFRMTLYGEKDCQYSSDGKDAGILRCPSMATPVSCREDTERTMPGYTAMCALAETTPEKYHRVAYCEW